MHDRRCRKVCKLAPPGCAQSHLLVLPPGAPSTSHNLRMMKTLPKSSKRSRASLSSTLSCTTSFHQNIKSTMSLHRWIPLTHQAILRTACIRNQHPQAQTNMCIVIKTQWTPSICRDCESYTIVRPCSRAPRDVEPDLPYRCYST